MFFLAMFLKSKTIQKMILLWMIKFFFHYRKDCRDHIFRKYLADNSESHTHLDEVCTLQILK